MRRDYRNAVTPDSGCNGGEVQFHGGDGTMKMFTRAALAALLLATATAGCDIRAGKSGKDDSIPNSDKSAMRDTIPSPPPPAAPTAVIDTMALPVTLPLLDAFFADSTFATDLKG